MKKTLKRWGALLLVFAMVFALAACSSSDEDSSSDDAEEAVEEEETAEVEEEAEEEAPAEEATEEEAAPAEDGDIVYGGTLSVYWSEFYSEYDASANDNRNFVDLYCNSLWALDAENADTDLCETLSVDQIEGSLAESWEIADDYTSMTVKLREGVHFADKTAVGFDAEYDIYGGRELTASDVKYSYDRVLGLDGVTQIVMDQTDWPSYLVMLDSVEVLDDYTLQFNFNTDSALQVDNFMCVMLNICGPEWDELDDSQKTDWHYAGGTGAFIITDYTLDANMTLVANPNYWATDSQGNPLPYLGELNLVHTLDTATMLSYFISGQLQALLANNILIDQDQASQIPAGTYTEYVYSSDCPAVALKLGNNPVEALKDVRVRTAMQYAVDSDAISQYQGYIYETEDDKNINLYYKGLSYYNPDSLSAETLESYTTFDLDKAQELLDEAGYGDGFEFDVYLYEAQPIESFQLAAETLAQIGITMNIIVVQSPPEMSIHGSDPDDPASMYTSIGNSRTSNITAVFRSDGVMNSVFQTNDEIDSYCDAFQNATTVEEQQEAADALNEAYMSQHYCLITSYAQTWSAYVANNVHGFTGARWTLCYNAGEIMSHIWVD